MKYLMKRERDDYHEGKDDQSRDRTHDRGNLDESRNRVEKLERPFEWPGPDEKEKGDD